MRVVYLSPASQLGGAERSLLDILASLEELDRWVVIPSEGPLAERARALGASVRVLPIPRSVLRLGDSAVSDGSLGSTLRLAPRLLLGSADAARFARSLRRVLRELAPTLVHVNGLKLQALTPLWRPRGVPVVWHLRDQLSARSLASFALKPAAPFADLGVAISSFVAADAAQVLPRLAVRVVHNAIDTDHFAPEGPAADLEGLAGASTGSVDATRVGLVATYARWKGHELFLRAAKRVLRSDPSVPCRFFVVGGPIYDTTGSQVTLDELRRLAGELGIQDDVAFVPFQVDPAPVFRGLDVVVHASTRPEPFGRTIAEGMSCGRAVVATAAGGAAELLSGGAGLGVGMGDEAALAEAILQLARDPERRAALGALGRETALGRFSRERLGQELLPLYARVLGRRL